MFGAPHSLDRHNDQLLREREEARKLWPFLTHYDLSTLRTPAQLASMVKDRKGISQVDAVVEVDRWMKGYNARTHSGSLERWENEGGGEPTKTLALPRRSGIS
jgi:hypothetical protein